ncbi:ExeA family protein [Rugamonas rubra]|uniref:Type II secretory pathway, component ExeA (Predicted ATPase) n=1 Tax=Rugamonas rubra TaxID=758825 RepID=A0A1I4P3H3_9BURK|nr:AAA family ATPase [Rugamonas rubra]SFM22404.1 Type II secretory pathway, component ExeA (predicted ATPase) [Rugamonas rubra]
MYQAHFGLTQSPFGITPNPSFFYSGNTRGEILQALLYVVGHGEGITKVTGEVGSGKTMLCRMLESQLPPHIEVIYLVNPSLSPLEALFAIASELGLKPDGKRGDEVLRELHADLIAKHGAGRQVVLLVEEAQAMPLATLEEIRLLTNLETAHHKLLQIVLFGQPELDASLNLPHMRQLKERITHSFEVPAMAPELVADFLDFRLRAAGYQGGPAFSPAAARLIARASQGIVRRINILADKALLAAFADDSATVEAAHAKKAIQESRFVVKNSIASPLTLALSLTIVLLLCAIAWLALRPPAPPQRWTGTPSTSPAGAAPGAPEHAPAAVPAAPAELLRQTLRDSQTWLRGEPAERLSLQIDSIPLSERAHLERFLLQMREAIGLTQIHAYPRRVDGVLHIAMAYGSYPSRTQAEAVQTLLAERWAYRPHILAIGAIRADVAAVCGAAGEKGPSRTLICPFETQTIAVASKL